MLPGGLGQQLGKTPWDVAVRCTSFALAAFPPLHSCLLKRNPCLCTMVSWLATPWAEAKAGQRDGLSLQNHVPLPSPVCS